MAAAGEISKTGSAERRTYWGSHIEAWRRSGQSKQGYCRKHGLNRGSFQRWCGRLSKETPAQASFIPVRLPAVAGSSHAVELTLRNGRVLRLCGDADPSWIAQLAQALDRAC